MSELPELPKADESDRPEPRERYFTQLLTRAVPAPIRAIPRRRLWLFGAGAALVLVIAVIVASGGSSQAEVAASSWVPEETDWVDEQIEAWDDANLEPGGFAEVDPSSLKASECAVGAARALEVTLCRFDSESDAATAIALAEKSIGAATGVAVARDDRLLVVVDRRAADPSGRSINRLVKSFR